MDPYAPSPRLAPGDPPVPDGDATNVATWQDLLDARRYLRGASGSLLVWNGHVRVTGTAAAPVVVLGPIEAVTLASPDGTRVPYVTATETTLGLAHVEGAPAALVADATYYAYAYALDNDPNPHFALSRTPPTELASPAVRRAWKRGETTNHRHLATFFTDGDGHPIAVTAAHGRYVYARAQYIANQLRATAPTLVSLAARVPPYARVASLNASTWKPGGGNGARQVEVGPALLFSASVDTSAEGYTATTLDAPLSAAQEVTYQWTTQDPDLGQASELTLHVTGWWE